MVSIKDVAKLAGVSFTTVSRTLGNNYPVSAKTRKLVMDAVNKLGYEPNIMGRNLRKTENKTVLVAGLGFVSDMLTGIYEAANEMGYEVILMHTHMSQKDDYVRRIKNGMTSGILFLNMLDDQTIVEIGANYPIVQCAEYADVPNACSVTIDDESAVYELTEMLIKQGRRRLAFVSTIFSKTFPRVSEYRKRGFLRALSDNRLETIPQLLIECEFMREDYTPALEIAEYFAELKPSERPDAIICGQDIIALTCANTFIEAGISVPDEIAVASLDDSPINPVFKPSITAIRRPYEAMGRESMKLLAATIEGKLPESKRVIFRHQIIERRSTAGSRAETVQK